MKKHINKIVFILMGFTIIWLIRENKSLDYRNKSETVYFTKIDDFHKPFYVKSIEDIKVEDIIDFSKPVHFDSVHLNFDDPVRPPYFQILITRGTGSIVYQFKYEIID